MTFEEETVYDEIKVKGLTVKRLLWFSSSGTRTYILTARTIGLLTKLYIGTSARETIQSLMVRHPVSEVYIQSHLIFPRMERQFHPSLQIVVNGSGVQVRGTSNNHNVGFSATARPLS